jgi:phage baseplate assembly protein V
MSRALIDLFARGVVKLVDAARKMQSLQVSLLADEIKEGLEHFEPYGFTSNPQPGAEVVAVFLEGDRSHGLVVVVADRRYRVTGLQPGEVCFHDDQGARIILSREGIAIIGGGRNIAISGAPMVILTDGDLVADGISLKNHVHNGVTTGGSNTGVPQ